jgi:hypothetical protein
MMATVAVFMGRYLLFYVVKVILSSIRAKRPQRQKSIIFQAVDIANTIDHPSGRVEITVR